MSKVSAFHTNSDEYRDEDRKVFHDQSECGYGEKIKSWHREDGTGGRDRCDRLRQREFLLVVDLQVVAQDTAAWVDIGILRHLASATIDRLWQPGARALAPG